MGSATEHTRNQIFRRYLFFFLFPNGINYKNKVYSCYMVVIEKPFLNKQKMKLKIELMKQLQGCYKKYLILTNVPYQSIQSLLNQSTFQSVNAFLMFKYFS